MLWNVRIPLKQKLGLIGIFSLTVVVMVFAVIRVVVVSGYSKQADVTWLYFWTNLEMTIGTGFQKANSLTWQRLMCVQTAVIVSCLAVFKQLFTKHENRHPQPTHSDGLLSSLRRGISNAFALRTARTSPGATHDQSLSGTQRLHPLPSFDSERQIVPLDRIYVRSDIRTSNGFT